MSNNILKIFLKTFLTALVFSQTFLLISCSIYKMPIAQGKHMNMSDLLHDSRALKPGLTEEQIIEVLGEPSYKSILEKNTWYYVHSYTPHNGEPGLTRQMVLAMDSKSHLKTWKICYNLPLGLTKEQAISHLGPPLNQDLSAAIWDYRLNFSKTLKQKPVSFKVKFKDNQAIQFEGIQQGHYCAHLP